MISLEMIGAIAARRRGGGGGGGGGGPETDPYFASVVALLHFDGADASTTFTDQKGHTFTANGNAQIDTAQSKFGGASGLFDGNGDWITTPDSADLEMGAGDFTVEGWMRPNSIAAGFKSIISKRATEPNFGWLVVTQNGSTLELYASSDNSSWNIASAKSLGTVATGNWYHWAISRSGNTWRGFLGGVLGSGFPITSSLALSDNAASLAIGAGAANGGQPYNGWIDDVRITKGVARYTSNFTPPTAAFPDS